MHDLNSNASMITNMMIRYDSSSNVSMIQARFKEQMLSQCKHDFNSIAGASIVNLKVKWLNRKLDGKFKLKVKKWGHKQQ